MTTKMLLLALALTGCALDDQELELAESEHEIQTGDDAGSPATSFQWRRGVVLAWNGTRAGTVCTGTLISRRHMITAAHCTPMLSDEVLFFTSSSIADESSDISVAGIAYPPGVDPVFDDLHDVNGKFADMAIVTLAADAPSTSFVADLAWTYPAGGDDFGYKVGAGKHDNNEDLFGRLRYAYDQTYSDNDRDGHFLTENEQSNPGDSGGPFYYQSRVLGVLNGWVTEWEFRNKYASTPFRLSWILSRIGYVWSGDAELAGVRRGGTVHSSFIGTKSACQYACERTGACLAYSHRPAASECKLLSTLGALYTDANYSTATK